MKLGEEGKMKRGDQKRQGRTDSSAQGWASDESEPERTWKLGIGEKTQVPGRRPGFAPVSV